MDEHNLANEIQEPHCFKFTSGLNRIILLVAPLLLPILMFIKLFIAVLAGWINPSHGAYSPFSSSNTLPLSPIIATPDTFNPHFSALNSPNRRITSRLPPETRLAWLEYLANAYVQCDDFAHAREIIDEMYFWLVERPNLRRGISTAMRILQRRIDERHDCLLGRWGPDACRRELPQPNRHTLLSKWKSPRSDLRDVTEEAAANMAQVMSHFHKAGTIYLTPLERRQLRSIYQTLKRGYVTAAISSFQRFLLDHPSAMEKESVRKFEFVLKLVKFDLENPDNCMPLWRTTCCMDYRIKRRILDTFELLKGRGAGVATALITGSGRTKSVDDILNNLDDIPMYHEVRARLLTATGRTEAWPALRSLHLRDQYVAEACLILKGINRPPLTADYPELFGDVSGTAVAAKSNSTLSNSPFDVLEARSRAKTIYERCIYDHHLGLRHSRRCQEGLAAIQGLERACPYSGFVRIGLFSQVFGDYLFIKCLSPPPIPTPLNSVRISTLGWSIPKPRRPRSPPSPVPPLTARHYRLLERLSKLVKEFKDTLKDVEPVHQATLTKIQSLDPRQVRPTQHVLAMNRNIDDQLDLYLYRMHNYLQHLRKIGRSVGLSPLGRLTTNQSRQRRRINSNTSPQETMGQISQALADLAADLQLRRNNDPY